MTAIRFGQEIWDVSMIERKVSNLKPGDFLLSFNVDGESLVRVDSVSPEAVDFFLHKFVSIVAFTATGQLHQFREGLSEKTMVYRPRRRIFGAINSEATGEKAAS